MARPTMLAATRGAVAGLIATAPMSIAMKGIHVQLPWRHRETLPPKQITEALADKVGLDDELDIEEMNALSLASHFAYGAGSGALFGAVARDAELSPVASGIGFGLAVWAASYLGWLPAARVRRSAAQESAGVNVMMIGSHLVWGVTTAFVYDALRRRG